MDVQSPLDRRTTAGAGPAHDAPPQLPLYGAASPRDALRTAAMRAAAAQQVRAFLRLILP